MLVPVPLGVLHGVFEEEGDAGERSVVIRARLEGQRIGLGTGLVEAASHQGPDHRVQPIDAFDRLIDQVA